MVHPHKILNLNPGETLTIGHEESKALNVLIQYSAHQGYGQALTDMISLIKIALPGEEGLAILKKLRETREVLKMSLGQPEN